jgi:biotin transport system permease protein
MLTVTSPVETRAHRIPAGVKLAAMAVATTALVQMHGAAVAVALAGVVALYLSLGLPFARHGLRMLRPLWPFLLVLAVWHGWTGEWARGAEIAGKMLAAVALANLVTMTTRLDDLIAVVERLARPLARLGLDPRVLAVAIGLALRFTPVLFSRTGQLMEAWRARSARRPGWRVVLPAVLLALDDADHVAEALRARGGL